MALQENELKNESIKRSDNDIYGHVNNIVYYSYFDTAANQYLIDHAELMFKMLQLLSLWLTLIVISLNPLRFQIKLKLAYL